MQNAIIVGDLVIDRRAQEVQYKGKAVMLTHTEHRIINYLATDQRRAISKAEIMRHCWPVSKITSNNVEAYIHRIRRLFGKQVIKNRQNFGYKLTGKVDPTLTIPYW